MRHSRGNKLSHPSKHHHKKQVNLLFVSYSHLILAQTTTANENLFHALCESLLPQFCLPNNSKLSTFDVPGPAVALEFLDTQASLGSSRCNLLKNVPQWIQVSLQKCRMCAMTCWFQAPYTTSRLQDQLCFLTDYTQKLRHVGKLTCSITYLRSCRVLLTCSPAPIAFPPSVPIVVYSKLHTNQKSSRPIELFHDLLQILQSLVDFQRRAYRFPAFRTKLIVLQTAHKIRKSSMGHPLNCS